MLVGISLVSTIGLAATLFTLLRGRIETPWPWVNTDVVLLVGLSVAILAFVVYLTGQQRCVTLLRRHLEGLEAERAARMRQHYERLMALLNVSRIMGSETNLQAVFDAITRTCVEIFDCERVSLMQLDPANQELAVQSATGRGDVSRVVGARLRLGEGIAGRVAEEGKALILRRDDVRRFQGSDPQDLRMTEAMVVPIVVRGELVGVLNVGTRSPEVHYDDEDLKALQVFAENAGACIRHAEQAEWMRQTIQRLDASRQGAGGAGTPDPAPVTRNS